MDTFMTPIEQHYWEQEKRLPSQSVVLIMRKLFILEEIFEQNPDITIQNKYDLNFESIGNNLDYTFKNKIITNISEEDISQKAYLKTLLSELQYTDELIEKEINKHYYSPELESILQNKDLSYEHKYFNDFFRGAFLLGETITLSNRIGLYEDFCNITSYSDKHDIFLDFQHALAEGKNYTPTQLNVFGQSIPELPVSKEDTYNSEFYDKSFQFKQNFYYNLLLSNTIDFINEIESKIKPDYCFLVQEKEDKMLYALIDNYEETVFEKEYPLYIEPYNQNKFLRICIDYIDDIFSYYSTDNINISLSNFMIKHIPTGSDKEELKELFEKELHIAVEKIIIDKSLSQSDIITNHKLRL